MTIVKYLGSFIIGLTIAMFMEDDFHLLVRYLYESLTYNMISFDVPKLDFYFFSLPFIILAGLYSMVLFFLFGRQTTRQRLINFIASLIFLFSTFLLSCYVDANIKLIECTNCDDGTRVLDYYDINYTKIFIITLLTSLIPTIWTEVKTRRKSRQQTVFKASL